MDILCRVTTAGLVPMYDSDYDEKHRLREGETVLCTIRKPRNYEFHKKFFALVRIVFNNLPERLVRMLNVQSEDDSTCSSWSLDCTHLFGMAVGLSQSLAASASRQWMRQSFRSSTTDALTLHLQPSFVEPVAKTCSKRWKTSSSTDYGKESD